MAKINFKFVLTFFVTALIAINCFGQSWISRTISGYYNGRNYAAGRAFADSLIKANNGTYLFSPEQLSSIGVFRLEAGDFKGAIKDFDQVMALVDTTNWTWPIRDVEHYKPAAHLALGQKRQAALSFEYIARHYKSTYSAWQGLVLYMNNDQEAKFREFLPIALSCYRGRMENDSLTRLNS